MHSCLYTGQIKHHRYLPHGHFFKYSLFMLYLDLDELSSLFNPYWLWSVKRTALVRFKRSDHLGDPSVSLSDSVRSYVRENTGKLITGPIRLLTQLRHFGYGFNPVSFYYCFDKKDKHVEVIVVEVNNTPWREQYCYVLTENDNHGSIKNKYFSVHKRFHVSPFMPMNIDYEWRFNQPTDQLVVYMKNYRQGDVIFDATLSLKRKPINSRNLALALIHFPFMSIKIIIIIYWEALRLFIKKTPVFDHPSKQ